MKTDKALKDVERLVLQHRAEWGLHDLIEVLAWEVEEGDDEGEEYLSVDYLLPDSDNIANVTSTTLITEVMEDYHFDLSSLDPQSFKREDRDTIVNAMYTALAESDKARDDS